MSAINGPSRTYQDALDTLNSLQSNAQTIEKWKNTRLTDKNVTLKEEVEYFCEKANIDVFPQFIRNMSICTYSQAHGYIQDSDSRVRNEGQRLHMCVD